jgi:predicted small lipoprotein YifL
MALRIAIRLPWPRGCGYTPRMNMRLAAALVLAAALLAGCGNKGPLMLPSAAPAEAVEMPADAPAAPSTTTAPTDIEIPVEPPVAPEGVQPAPATPPADGGNG